MRAKQGLEMDLVKKKAAEEMLKSKREELLEQLSESEAPKDESLQAQTGTGKANPAGRVEQKALLTFPSLFTITLELVQCMFHKSLLENV